MALPADPVVVRNDVIAWSKLTANIDTDALDLICEAVDGLVRELPAVLVFVDATPALAEWPARYKLGSRLLAARLYRRRDSAEGVAAITAEGVAYVRRNDPDVAEQLRMNFESVS